MPVDAWETIPLIQRLMFPKARETCSAKYFDGRKVATTVLRAVGVPYFGMPLFYFHGVSLPKTEFKFEGGFAQSQMVLEIPKAVKGVRGVRRRLQVEYRDYTWEFIGQQMYNLSGSMLSIAAYSWNGAWGYRNEAHTGGLQKVGVRWRRSPNRLFAEAQPAHQQPRAAIQHGIARHRAQHPPRRKVPVEHHLLAHIEVVVVRQHAVQQV